MMENYIYQDVAMMIDDGDYLDAFELICYLFLKVGDVDIDDSDGGVGVFADLCFETWDRILNEVNGKIEKKMYNWFIGHLDGSVIDYMEEYIEKILMQRFKSTEYLKDKLKYSSEDEWLDIREKIFALLQENAQIAHLYKYEKLYDRLLEYVLKRQGMNYLFEYEDVLKEKYPQELFQKYTANRKKYQEWIMILSKMIKITGGKEVVKKIVANWRIMYGNRRAMMEEISQLYEEINIYNTIILRLLTVKFIQYLIIFISNIQKKEKHIYKNIKRFQSMIQKI